MNIKIRSNKKGGGTLLMGMGFSFFLIIMLAIMTDMGSILISKVHLQETSDVSVMGASNYAKNGTQIVYREYDVDEYGNKIGNGRIISTHDVITIDDVKAREKASQIFNANMNNSTYSTNPDYRLATKNYADESGGLVTINSNTIPLSFWGSLTEVLSSDKKVITSAQSEVRK